MGSKPSFACFKVLRLGTLLALVMVLFWPLFDFKLLLRFYYLAFVISGVLTTKYVGKSGVNYITDYSSITLFTLICIEHNSLIFIS